METKNAQSPLTVAQRLKVRATAGLPVQVSCEALREWASLIEQAEHIIADREQEKIERLETIIYASEHMAEGTAAYTKAEALLRQNFTLMLSWFLVIVHYLLVQMFT